jgi:hypothetical protein
MIPGTGNNDLSDDKKEIFFALPLDAELDGPSYLQPQLLTAAKTEMLGS